MRQVTLSNMLMGSGQRQTLSSQAAGMKFRRRYMTSASKSLDLLRLNIQKLLNKEIDNVIKKYLDKFFKPAIINIKNNLGENSVTDENIRIICRQILEDAKAQYYADPKTESEPYKSSESRSTGQLRFGSPMASRSSLSSSFNKKKEFNKLSEASHSIPKQKKKFMRSSGVGASTSVKPVRQDNIKREGPKWDPNRIVKSTLFIMGARANKILGFGQTRGRLYTKHPELLKYSGDTEDKEWLSRHNLMPPTGGIAYLMLLEDVKELAESREYRRNPNVMYKDLKGFQAPEFMLRKIRAFIEEARTDNKKTPPMNLENTNIITTAPPTVYTNVAPPTMNTNVNNQSIEYMDINSLMMPPPATLPSLECSSLYDSLELNDLPSDLPNDILSSDDFERIIPSVPSTSTSNMVLEGLLYCENKPYQSLLSAYGNFPNSSFLSSSLENDSSQETV